ncbi:MAG: saccharopine dehydrogenase family protein [Endomicrobia bacterium]|nr:saccharopine dehydrogenase family protein [Endomicrobiia bacterium]
MVRKNILLIGAGGVAHVAAHKIALNNDILGNLCIASRTQSKCDKIIESIKRKGNIKDPSKKIYSRQVNALDVKAVVELIKETESEMVINLGQSYLNMSVLEACIETGAAYFDTAIHEEPDKVCEDPPWYANYEWKRKDRCAQKGITAILSVGADPGIVNAYTAYGKKHYFDEITTVDIVDVNAGNHGKFFATNFDPEINFREFIKAWVWIDKKWVAEPVHTIKREFDLPGLGKYTVYLNGHDEIHSLSQNMDINTIRFWMYFSDHYLNVFNTLKNLGLTSHQLVRTHDGREVIPLRLLKALLPDPASLAGPNYTGVEWIGNFIVGKKNGKQREMVIYLICDHQEVWKEVESHAICYTAGVPPVVAAILVAKGVWDVRKMVNVEELDPDPFLETLSKNGLKTYYEVKEIEKGEI